MTEAFRKVLQGNKMGAETKEEPEMDDRGLLPESKAKSEADGRKFYFKLQFVIQCVIAPVLAGLVSGVMHMTSSTFSSRVGTKLAFIKEWELGYLYAVWYAAFVGKTYAMMNANCARGPARVDRPDQFVFQIMDAKGPLKDAPYVLLANEGPLGRFNRAQRAAANLDETLPLFITGLLLTAAVYGPIAFAISLLYLYGAIQFAESYKEATKLRVKGFLPTMVANQLTGAFIGIVAIKSLVF